MDRLAHIRPRLRRLWLVELVLLLLCVGQLWRMQVAEGAHYAALGNQEGVRTVALPAARGQILDRNGHVLATSVPTPAAFLTYSSAGLSQAEADRLGSLLGMRPTSVTQVAKSLAVTDPYGRALLKSALTPAQATTLEEQAAQFPGVVVSTLPERQYPNGDLAAQVLGYVSAGPTPGDLVGRAGVEATYNKQLSGVDGKEVVRVNALGDPLRTLSIRPPQPGDSVTLTLNGRLQAVAEQALAANMAQERKTHFADGGPFPATQGAAVVIDPHNGQILALASMPEFNPNTFARGAVARPGGAAWRAWQQQWAALSSPSAPGHPLVDHAVSDLSAPASTFKPITALAALTAHAITPTEPISCPWYITVDGVRKHNWVPGFYGIFNLDEAIARSCDTYFYQVGVRTGITRIEAMARAFGLGALTGQKALPGENPGLVAGPDTKRALGYKAPWYPSETMDAAIGQSFNEYNALEMANYVATLANGGTRYRPYLVREVTSPSGKVILHNHPQVLGHVPAPASAFAAVHQAMGFTTTYQASWKGITDVPWGTAWVAFLNWPQVTQKYLGHVIHVAGKTGTAQVNGKANNAWFIAFAPMHNPQLAIAVYVRGGGEGLIAGAPVARDIIAAYYGLPANEVAQVNY